MNDDKQIHDEELEIDFDDEADLFEQDIYDLDDDQLFEDVGSDFEAAAPEKAEENPNKWLILGLILLAIALADRLTLAGGVFEAQKDIESDSAALVSQISLVTTAAESALTSSGDYQLVSTEFENLEVGLQGIQQHSKWSAIVADKFFANPVTEQRIAQVWQTYQQSVRSFLDKAEQVSKVKLSLVEADAELSDTVNETIVFVDAVAKEGRSKGNDAAKNRYLFLSSEAANISGILNRMSNAMEGYYMPSVDLQDLSDNQNTLAVRLKDTVVRITGNAAAVVATAAEPLLARVDSIEAKMLAVGDNANAIAASRIDLQNINVSGTELRGLISEKAQGSGIFRPVEIAANWFALLLLIAGSYSLLRYFRSQNRELVESEGSLSDALADQQESILKLLDEMSSLADGDLTVQAEVTDQITGAIADSVNFAVIEMRELVSQINRASVEVANESALAVNNAQSVSESNTQQAEQVSVAAIEMQRITQSMKEMSEQALSSADMASESQRVASQGAQAVRDTIASMDDMREQIQDTSKRIKRLGESSQRIGDIVALIDDIAEQTNILSLNAAIQASMAGEAGRGFAVVSDEVQSLAERSTEATKRIAELVTTIQNDTNDAVSSMEKATQQVVSGTKIADSAGSALAEIERASNSLSDLIKNISEHSRSNAEIVTDVAEKVTVVSESSTATSSKAQDSANSIAKLLELAKELETSVSRFKLPAS